MLRKFSLEQILPLIIVFFVVLSIFGKNVFPVLVFVFIIYLIISKFKKLNLSRFASPGGFKKHMDANNVIDMDNLKKANIKLPKKIGLIILAIVILAIILPLSIVIIPAGATGVYHLFGKVRDAELASGLHLKNPLADVTKMSIRTEEYTMTAIVGEGQVKEADAISALTKEGLQVDLDITVLYHLQEDKASEVFKNVGLDYIAKIIRPSIRSGIREVVANYDSKDIYSEKREQAAIQILEKLKNDIDSRGIIIEEVLLRNVNLPAKISNAIQEKLAAEQESQRYDFVLDKEKKEAERKIIEAEGQRDAQRIINQSLTPNYLNYLYIKELKDREGTIYVPIDPANGIPMFKGL